MKNRKKARAREARRSQKRKSKLMKSKGKKRIYEVSDSDDTSDSESPEMKKDSPEVAAAWNDIYTSLVPSHNNMARRRELIQALESIVVEVDENATLTIYGSYDAGLLLKGGDVDISVNVNGEAVNELSVLQSMEKLLKKRPNFSRLTMNVAADKERLDGQYERIKQRIAFDMTVNNAYSPLSSRFLKSVAAYNSTFKKLLVIVKSFFKNHLLIEPSNGSLASVAICYLVIFFLQQTYKIPCFLESKIAPTIDQYLHEAEEYGKILPSQTAIGITSILTELFEFYSTFDFNKFAISVRDNEVIRKAQLNWDHPLAIVDPFKRKRNNENVGKSFNKKGLSAMNKGFNHALKDLYKGRLNVFKWEAEPLFH